MRASLRTKCQRSYCIPAIHNCFFILIVLFTVGIRGEDCPWRKVFSGAFDLTNEDVANHYMELIRQVNPKMLLPENAKKIIESKNPFAIPADIPQDSDTLNAALKEFEEMLSNRFKMDELKEHCLEKLAGKSAQVGVVVQTQEKLDRKVVAELKVLMKSTDPVSDSSNSEPQIVFLNEKPVLIYGATLQKPNIGKLAAMDLTTAKVTTMVNNPTEKLNGKVAPFTVGGNQYYLAVGKTAHVFDANHTAVNSQQRAIASIEGSGKITSALPLGSHSLVVSLEHPNTPGKRPVLTYDFATGNQKPLFTADNGNAEVADVLHIGADTYIAMGSVWKEYVELVKVAADGTVTRKAVDTKRDGYIGASLEGKLYETPSGDVGYLFRGDKEETISFGMDGTLKKIPVIPGVRCRPKIHRLKDKSVAVVETGGPHNPLFPSDYGWATVIDLEKKEELQKIQTPKRSTSLGSFVDGGRLYLTWGTQDGKVALMEAGDTEPGFSSVINPYMVGSVIPYKVDGAWNAAVTFTGMFAKKHYGPAILRLTGATQ